LTPILEANSIKDLGVTKPQANQIKKLGNEGFGAVPISEETGVSRRRVMRTLELLGLREYSEGAYA